MKIEITNGSLLNAKGEKQAFHYIHIMDGKIHEINYTTPRKTSAFVPDEVINAQGCLVIPGLVDLNVSLRDPGYPAKGSMLSETSAAAAGGVTTLCCTPETDPINDSEAVTKFISKLAQSTNKCQVLPLGALTQGLNGEQLSEYSALKQAGCVALSNAYHPIKNLAITKRCFEYAKTHNLSVFINPIEASLHEGVMHENHVSTTIGLQGIPSLAETIAVSQLIQLAEASEVHLHLSQLSAADSVTQVKAAKEKGIKITADVAISHLLFTDENVKNFDSIFHCTPPLRSEQDRNALISAVKSGVIDAITSSHQPHEAAAKKLPFAESAAGISSIELLIPMAIMLDENKNLPLFNFVSAMTTRSARVLSLSSNEIVPGNAANLCIIDPLETWTLTAENLLSQGKNSPLIGQTLKGKVKATIYEGSISFSDN